MNSNRKIQILDRVRYIAEHFDSLSLMDMITYFVATATLFEDTNDHFYDSYMKVMRQTIQAKMDHQDPRAAILFLEEH